LPIGSPAKAFASPIANEASHQVRCLKASKIPLRFAVFDERDAIIVFPDRPQSRVHEIDSLWLRMPELAKILHGVFERLWKKGEPALSILKKIKKEHLE